MPWEADLPVVLSLFLTFTHYLNECDPYHKQWRMVDLATRPVQAGRPQTLVEAAQTFVERPILLGPLLKSPARERAG